MMGCLNIHSLASDSNNSVSHIVVLYAQCSTVSLAAVSLHWKHGLLFYIVIGQMSSALVCTSQITRCYWHQG